MDRICACLRRSSGRGIVNLSDSFLSTMTRIVPEAGSEHDQSPKIFVQYR